MTKLNEGKLESGLNGCGDAEFYIFAVPEETAVPLLEHVIHKAANERTARGLCVLFTKRPSALAGIHFRHLPVLSFGAEEQMIIDEVIERLDGYSQPNSDAHAAEPSAEVLWRAQCAASARKWDRRLREKLQADRAQRLEAGLKNLLVITEPGFAAGGMSAEERLEAVQHTLRTLVQVQNDLPVTGRSGWSGASPEPAAIASATTERIKIGRLEYRPDFCEVWVDGQRFDLTTRVPARRCLQFLVEKEAFTEETAREFSEIHAFVAEPLGSMANEPRIHHYFNDAKRKLTRLRSDLIKPVARTGRYFLAV